MTTTYDTASAAQAYIERGWSVIPLHDVSMGTCSCDIGSREPQAEPAHSKTQGGKHPLWGGWQNAGIRDPGVAASVWAGRPQANIGIVTGRASGIWVLDVDPEHDGDGKLISLIVEHGPLPETWTVQTGSQGRHYYWQMPAFDFTTSRGRLPVGLDVRGNRGQVVAPPSHTLKGPYQVLVAAPVADAPAWLLDLIRPKAPEAPIVGDAPLWPGGLSTGEHDRGRGSEYALAAVRSLLAELAAAVPGSRNDTAYRVGRRLAELVNSPWAGLDGSAVAAWYMAAAAACDVDGGFTQAEAEDVLNKAIRAQAGRGAALPEADFYGTVWTPPQPVFPPGTFPAGTSDASNKGSGGSGPMGGGDRTDFDQAGQGPATSPFTAPGTGTSAPVDGQLINGYGEQPKVADPWEDAVARAVSALLVRREAEKRVRAWGQAPTDFAQLAMDDAALALLPAPDALVMDWLDLDTLARVNGPSGHGKSFVVLDMAACVATGRAWHGHAVRRSKVCYVVAEGARGMAKRAQAWCLRHELDQTGIVFIPEPVQVAGTDWDRFIVWAAAEGFGLVIIDTQARSTVGVDENDATEMGEVIAGLDRLRAATGACVALIHHRGLRGEHGRGSSAVRGALDAEMDVSRQGLTVTLKSVKQKDRADPQPKHFVMNAIGESLVLIGELENVSSGPFTAPAAPVLTLREKCSIAIARALQDASGSGLTRAEAMTHARVTLDLGADETTKRLVRRAWADLMKLGRLAKAEGREAYYFIDLDGLPVLQENPDKMIQGGPERYVP